jgi:hypothetical protein
MVNADYFELEIAKFATPTKGYDLSAHGTLPSAKQASQKFTQSM